jgi:DNA polymerase-4
MTSEPLRESTPVRRIVHVDMDAFYASVEQRDDPSLRGRPVAVGGAPDRRGVVAAASYEARDFGVRSAIPMAQALRLCPALVVIRPDFRKYRAVSAQVFEIFRTVTALVEPLSLDEAYLDVTQNNWAERLGSTVARRLKSEIHAATSLTASAGVAPNKFLAKIASGWKKPDGLTVVAPARVEAFLQDLSVDSLWGVGPVTAKRLRDKGITRLVDVREAPQEVLRGAVGNKAAWLEQMARGIDERPVTTERDSKSSGSEHTFAEDVTELAALQTRAGDMAWAAAKWLERRHCSARTVVLKIRYSDFTTITRSHSEAPTHNAARLAARAVSLLTHTDAGHRPVRLLGVSVQKLTDDRAESGQSRLPFLESS